MSLSDGKQSASLPITFARKLKGISQQSSQAGPLFLSVCMLLLTASVSTQALANGPGAGGAGVMQSVFQPIISFVFF
jgi:hypothetical protein